MVDYSDPGEIGALVTRESIEEIERLMEKDGYMDSKYMAMAFRLLRPDSLIWRYFAHNYLQGEMPPKSDFLYWNSDSTRLPAAMASFYLREFYLQNNLMKENGIAVGGKPIDLRRIAQPLYAVGAIQDHICPWKGTFKMCNLVKGPVRYAMAEEGHIAGIVNPPSAKSRKRYWAGEVSGPVDPDEWLSGQEKRQGSWWVDWVEWLSGLCGPKGEPPPMGSESYPPLERAPGTYVLEK
jgi:polyhydroxyalkanoate synthase